MCIDVKAPDYEGGCPIPPFSFPIPISFSPCFLSFQYSVLFVCVFIGEWGGVGAGNGRARGLLSL